MLHRQNHQKKHKFGKHLEIILRHICKMVGADFDKINFLGENWYRKHTWDEKQSEQFIKWFAVYLHSHKEARMELYNRMSCMRIADWVKAGRWFELCYGWRMKG